MLCLKPKYSQNLRNRKLIIAIVVFNPLILKTRTGRGGGEVGRWGGEESGRCGGGEVRKGGGEVGRGGAEMGRYRELGRFYNKRQFFFMLEFNKDDQRKVRV